MSGQQTFIVRAPARPGSVKTLVDGTLKADFYISKELPSTEMTALFTAMKQGEGWLLFSPNPIEEAAIPKEKADAQFEGKTPSQRLYNALYVRWAQLTDQSEPFDIFYAKFIEAVIARVKHGLPDRP